MKTAINATEKPGAQSENSPAADDFDGIPDALTAYLLGCLARYDDRHEYVD